MNIESTKEKLIEWIKNLDNPLIIKEIENIKKQSHTDWSSIPLNIQKLILQSEDEITDGHLISHETVIEKLNNRF